METDMISLMDCSLNNNDLLSFSESAPLQPVAEPRPSASQAVDLLLMVDDVSPKETGMQGLKDEIKDLNLKLERMAKEIDGKDKLIEKKDSDAILVNLIITLYNFVPKTKAIHKCQK